MIDLNSRRRIGTTQCMVGPLGLGTAPLGNLYESVSDTTAEATLTAAERCGITWFDAAPLYGSGLAEIRLGRHLRHSAGSPPVISTKVGRILKPIPHSEAHPHFIAPLPFRAVFDYSRDGIERSYQDSLRGLGVERVALLVLHDVYRLSHPSGHRALVTLLFG